MEGAAALEELLEANRAYAKGHSGTSGPEPSRRLAVVTCMDTRIDLLRVLGLGLGEAHVIRNAGARVTDDVLRSLALSTHVLGVDTVVLVQHTKCGLTGVTDRELRDRTGAAIEFFAISDHAEVLTQDVERILSVPWLEPLRTAAGWLYDVETGLMQEAVRRDRR